MAPSRVERAPGRILLDDLPKLHLRACVPIKCPVPIVMMCFARQRPILAVVHADQRIHTYGEPASAHEGHWQFVSEFKAMFKSITAITWAGQDALVIAADGSVFIGGSFRIHSSALCSLLTGDKASIIGGGVEEGVAFVWCWGASVGEERWSTRLCGDQAPLLLERTGKTICVLMGDGGIIVLDGRTGVKVTERRIEGSIRDAALIALGAKFALFIMRTNGETTLASIDGDEVADMSEIITGTTILGYSGSLLIINQDRIAEQGSGFSIWDVARGEQFVINQNATLVAAHPRSKLLAVVSDNGILTLWDGR